MKRNIFRLIISQLLLSILLLAGYSAFAQTGDSTANKITDRMKSRLSLTEEQYPKVLAVNKDFSDGMTGIKNSGGSKFEKFRKIKSLDQARDKALKDIRTKEQYALFETQKKNNREEAKKTYQHRH
jgi:hypothetical protein